MGYGVNTASCDSLQANFLKIDGKEQMICTCPKCKAPTQLDHADIPESGTDRICDACKSRFWLYRETFGGRALKKSGEIFCVGCGEELDRSIACPSCGELYPAFVFAQATKAAPKRTVHVRSTYYIRRRPTRKPIPKKAIAPKKPTQKLSIFNKYTISAVLLAVVITVGAVVYSKVKVVNEYSTNYTKILYAIKAGTDICLKPYEKVAASSGSSFSPYDPTPSLSANEQSRLNVIKAKVDTSMKKMENPPEKFVTAKEKLNNLYGVYAKIHAFALQPSGTMQKDVEAAVKMKIEFKKTSQELKSDLPKQLSEELENARAKYRNLRDF
jgi:hypothetical protein